MFANGSFARQLRLRRLPRRRAAANRAARPVGHGGSIAGGSRLNVLGGQLAANNVDAVVLHKELGRTRRACTSTSTRPRNSSRSPTLTRATAGTCRLAELIHQGFVPAPHEILQRPATVAD